MFLNKVTGRLLRTALVALLLVTHALSLYAGESEIPQAEDFAEVGRISIQQGTPVVVFVSRDACPYCRTLRDNILKPMLVAGKFEQRAILLELSLDSVDALVGFGKLQTTPKAFGDSYKATITPTLLFLDSEGNEIGKRIIGISNLELYGHYLQKSIDEALLTVRSENQMN